MIEIIWLLTKVAVGLIVLGFVIDLCFYALLFLLKGRG